MQLFNHLLLLFLGNFTLLPAGIPLSLFAQRRSGVRVCSKGIYLCLITCTESLSSVDSHMAESFKYYNHVLTKIFMWLEENAVDQLKSCSGLKAATCSPVFSNIVVGFLLSYRKHYLILYILIVFHGFFCLCWYPAFWFSKCFILFWSILVWVPSIQNSSVIVPLDTVGGVSCKVLLIFSAVECIFSKTMPPCGSSMGSRQSSQASLNQRQVELINYFGNQSMTTTSQYHLRQWRNLTDTPGAKPFVVFFVCFILSSLPWSEAAGCGRCWGCWRSHVVVQGTRLHPPRPPCPPRWSGCGTV